MSGEQQMTGTDIPSSKDLAKGEMIVEVQGRFSKRDGNRSGFCRMGRIWREKGVEWHSRLGRRGKWECMMQVQGTTYCEHKMCVEKD